VGGEEGRVKEGEGETEKGVGGQREDRHRGGRDRVGEQRGKEKEGREEAKKRGERRREEVGYNDGYQKKYF